MVLTYEFIILISVVFPCVIFIALYFHFTRNFKFWQKLDIPYAKPTPVFGNLKDCALQKASIGKQLQQMYEEHSDKPYVGIYSFDKPTLLIRDVELVKNILVKDSQYFRDRTISVNEEHDPLLSRSLFTIKGQRWRHLRTNLTPVFTSGKIKNMFYLMDTCGKELADCLHRATADGK
jgi:cytochrome P450 family 6